MTTKRILEGIRVLDLTNVLSGPFASLHLALLGAEVIKVENPKDGDLARKLGIVPDYNKRLMGTSFLAQNCNKKSVSLNTKSAEGKDIFKRLAKDADVIVENFRPGVMDRLGIGYKVVSEINPRIVFCAPSRASAPRAPTRTSRPMTRSSRASRGRWPSTATSA